MRAVVVLGIAASMLAACVGEEGVVAQARESALTGPCAASTLSGDVQGSDLGNSCAYQGIPFAASTAGANRWRPPQARAAWAPAVFSATTPVPNCPSQAANGAGQGTEDCLFLNIWAPDPAPVNAPVVVWFHTGAFTGASANFAGNNGKRLAEETGTIIVAPNYRLGAFGFLAHRALRDEDPAHPTTGNYALLDQQAALRWVRDNIASFGGNPSNVTIGGTSAGGASVGLQLVSPGSAGLYQGAIVESAYPTPTSRWTEIGTALSNGDAWATAIGCTDPATMLTCLRGKTRDQVLLAIAAGTQQVGEPANRVFWEPIVDGVVIPRQPRTLFQQGQFNQVPAIVGASRDEGWGAFITRTFPALTLAQYQTWVNTEFGADAPAILAQYPAASYPSPSEAMAHLVTDGQFQCEARRFAQLLDAQGLDVFLYSYNYEIDALSLDHVIHGTEAHMIFGNNYTTPTFAANYNLNAADLVLHNKMAGYWSEFAETGDPGSQGGLQWQNYELGDPRRIVFDTAISDGTVSGDICDFWSGFNFGGMLGALPASAPSSCPGDPQGDADVDSICGAVDNCPEVANLSQLDTDGDGQGDACDVCPNDASNDVDDDSVCGAVDNCPGVTNLSQLDTDGDGQGDACDVCPNDASNDADGDGLCADVDNCDSTGNQGQGDADGDGQGDACDVCPNDPVNDADGDGICADVDNCPAVTNSDQQDYEGDGIGDACDSDDDDDSVTDPLDNCPLTPNGDQADMDGDGIGNVCDTDPDGDGVVGALDGCPATAFGSVVNASGCSIADLAPCTPAGTAWKNHGAYVKAVTQAAQVFVNLGLITSAQKDAIVSAAAQSNCGQ